MLLMLKSKILACKGKSFRKVPCVQHASSVRYIMPKAKMAERQRKAVCLCRYMAYKAEVQECSSAEREEWERAYIRRRAAR